MSMPPPGDGFGGYPAQQYDQYAGQEQPPQQAYEDPAAAQQQQPHDQGHKKKKRGYAAQAFEAVPVPTPSPVLRPAELLSNSVPLPLSQVMEVFRPNLKRLPLKDTNIPRDTAHSNPLLPRLLNMATKLPIKDTQHLALSSLRQELAALLKASAT